jgi:hypothetical protein
MFIFKGFLPEEFYNHFLLLSSSIYLLNRKSITLEELFRTIKNLELFVGDFERLYGVVNMSFNVHQLLHACDDMRSKFGTIVGNFLPMGLKIQMVFSLICSIWDTIHEYANCQKLSKIYEAKGTCSPYKRFKLQK